MGGKRKWQGGFMARSWVQTKYVVPVGSQNSGVDHNMVYGPLIGYFFGSAKKEKKMVETCITYFCFIM